MMLYVCGVWCVGLHGINERQYMYVSICMYHISAYEICEYMVESYR